MLYWLSTARCPRLMRAAGTRCLAALFEDHHVLVATAFDADDTSGEGRLPVERRRRHDLQQPSGEATVVGHVPQRPIQPG